MTDPWTGVLAWNNAEGGTDGTAVTTGNSGGASGTAWNLVSLTGTSTLAYESTDPVHDTMSYLMTANGGVATLVWTDAVITSPITTQFCLAFYINIVTLPSSSTNLVLAQRLGSGDLTACRITITSTGRLRLLNAAAAQLVEITSATLSTGTVYRVEASVNPSTGAWTLEFYAGDSTTPLATQSGTGADFGDQIQRVTFGRSASPDYVAKWDSIGINTSPLGPRDANILDTPTNFTFARVPNQRLIEAAWTPVVGADHYELEVQVANGPSWDPLTPVTLFTPTDPSLDLDDTNGIDWSTSYRARVRAIPAP